MKVVGIFGISGVGKTTLIDSMIGKRSNWIRVSAGSLIQEQRPSVGRDSLRKLPLDGLQKNQEAIVIGLHRMRETTTAELILFDGHILVDNGVQLFEVPRDVIARLQLDALVFVEESPREIRGRRSGDPQRVRATRSLEEIAEEQSRARSIEMSYAQALEIAVNNFETHQAEELTAFQENILITSTHEGNKESTPLAGDSTIRKN
jgi:adenylate kinase